jgi:hypothetical protein
MSPLLRGEGAKAREKPDETQREAFADTVNCCHQKLIFIMTFDAIAAIAMATVIVHAGYLSAVASPR